MRQVGDEFIGEAVAEVLRVGVGTDVHEREYHHGPFGVRRWCDGRRRRRNHHRRAQRLHHLRAARDACLGSLNQQPINELRERRWYIGAEHGRRWRRMHESPRDRGLHGGAAERHVAGEHLEEHTSQREQVAAPVDGFTGGLPRAHVGRRAYRDAYLRVHRVLLSGRDESFADAEVGHHRMPFVQQKIFRLDVAMHHVVSVRVVERVGHFAGEAHDVIDGQSLRLGETVAQRFTRQQRHGEPERPVVIAGIVQRQDVRMREGRGEADFAQKAVAAKRVAEVGAQHLERHLTLVAQTMGAVHGGHTASAELRAKAVAVGEGGGEAGQVAGHPPMVHASAPTELAASRLTFCSETAYYRT